MIVRFQADADRSFLIVRKLLRREPDIDFQSATQAGLAGLSDPEVLALAARGGRILVSHDETTMPRHFAEFISLEAAAQRHSNDMANNNWFSHYGTDGSSPWDRIREAGYYPMLSGGENIAAGYSTVLSVIEGWLKSPGHCANIMSPYFREIGAAKAVNLSSTYRPTGPWISLPRDNSDQSF
jgi:hypothetical protein